MENCKCLCVSEHVKECIFAISILKMYLIFYFPTYFAVSVSLCIYYSLFVCVYLSVICLCVFMFFVCE